MRSTTSCIHALLTAALWIGVDKPLAIENATVIDVVSGQTRPNQTIVVRDGRIEKAGPSSETSAPADADKVDGSGKFLIPGLWDMHVHFASSDYAPLFVANGVVGVRDMHAHFPFMLLPLRKAIAEGKKVGPRILTPISMVDGAIPMWGGSLPAGDAEQGRKAVQTLKTKGADFVKIYSGLDKEALLAICDEAAKLGLMVGGHVPESVSALDASAAGVRSMEHLFGVLTFASTKEPELRAELVASIRGVPGRTFYPLLIRSQLKAIDTFSSERAASLYSAFKKNETYQCPTLTVHRMFAKLADPAFTGDPRNKYTPTLIKASWAQAMTWVYPIAKNASEQKKLYDKALEMVRGLNEAGAPILAGTDTSNPYCFAGFSLHDELALLVEAGLTPLAALQAATITPARFLKEEKSIGSIDVGKRADLVLLDANPLEDIRNTQKIRSVVLAGRFLDRPALDDLLTKSANAAAGKR